MIDRIRAGVMLLENGAKMPPATAIRTGHSAAGWSDIIGPSSSELSREIKKAGWTFFFMAGEIQVNGFGLNDQARMDHAMGRLIDAVKLQNCNCLEITGLHRKSFLGLPYTSVSAHARHIQKDRNFNVK